MNNYKNITVGISIHALVKRATAVYANNPHLLHYFNPRPREEGDSVKPSKVINRFGISIHALVKRATESSSALAFSVLFQSTPS